MKKLSFLLVVLFIGLSAATFAPIKNKSTVPQTPIAANQNFSLKKAQPSEQQNLLLNGMPEEFLNLSFEKLATITPSEYQKMTGKKLTFKQKIALKLIQKKLKKEIKNNPDKAKAGDNQIVATILCWLVGVIGVHRFYLGYTWQGIVQILTLGGCGIWTLIDFIRIIIGTLKPKDGEYTKTW